MMVTLVVSVYRLGSPCFRLQVLGLVLRAPSGFNIQPYECVVVTSEEGKKKLSAAMLGPNRER